MDIDLDKFESEWVGLAEEIVNRVFADPRIQEFKTQLRSGKDLTWEQKSEFIVISDQIKSDLIRQRYGEIGSDTYKDFMRRWEVWQSERGRKRDRPANLFEENISHFLYGSTPDPEAFLRNFDLYKDT
jgi:hypothetical protein